MSRTLAGKPAEVEVASLDIGDQIAGDWLPLIGVLYDPHNDLVAITLEGLDHMIRKPRVLYAEMEGTTVLSMAVDDADGARHILRLRTPLLLP